MKLILDTFSEVYNLLQPWADDEFWDLSKHEPVPGAVYVFCREQVNQHCQRIRAMAESGQFTVVIDNAAEGSETLVTWCYVKGLVPLIQQGKIILIGGGEMPDGWPHLQYENFLPKILDYEENRQAVAESNDIFTRTIKPYKFLFLNGRTRPHRKYLLERFQRIGVLDQALWTNLDRGLQLIKQQNGGYVYTDEELKHIRIEYWQDDRNVMHDPIEVHYLPKPYEVDRYRDRIDLPVPPVAFLDDHLFNKEWGEIYINPEPYKDTYFSLVTETVFDYPHSFRTEKIWKPVAMAHPFIAVANKGYYRSLHRLGFQTFGHVVDETFDQIDNSQQRIERIAEVVEDLCRQDLVSFSQACYNVCKYNQQHLADMSVKVRQEFPERFVKFIKSHSPYE